MNGAEEANREMRERQLQSGVDNTNKRLDRILAKLDVLVKHFESGAGSTGGAPTPEFGTIVRETASPDSPIQYVRLGEDLPSDSEWPPASRTRVRLVGAASRVPSESPPHTHENLVDNTNVARMVLTKLAEFFRDGMPKDAVENPSIPMAAFAAALYTDISSWRDREYPALSSESPPTEQKP